MDEIVVANIRLVDVHLGLLSTRKFAKVSLNWPAAMIFAVQRK